MGQGHHALRSISDPVYPQHDKPHRTSLITVNAFPAVSANIKSQKKQICKAPKTEIIINNNS